jgi:hypothetical protein
MMPHVLDRTHVFPVTDLRWRNGETFDNSTGEIRWNLRDGLTFHFELPAPRGLSDLGSTASPSTGGSGSLYKIDKEAEWIGKLGDGTIAHIFGTIAEQSGQVTTRNSETTAKRIVRGTASHAVVTLSKEEELAFWYATEPADRLFFRGLVLSVAVWARREDVNYRMGDSTRNSVRFILPLSSEPAWSLVRGPQNSGIWLTYKASGESDPLRYDKECEDVRGFVSLLTGCWTPYLWKDTFITADRLSRVYFGWHRGDAERVGHEQPIPICNGPEALKHATKIGEVIPELFARFVQLRPTYNPEWIASPTWAAQNSFADDQLAFYCVSLERFAAAHDEVIKARAESASAPLIIKKDARALKQQLKEAVAAFNKDGRLSTEALTVIEKRIDQINQTPNSNIYKKVFSDLGITLTEWEFEVVEERNTCFHGRATMPDSQEPGALEKEVLRVDTLRTLINRGLLALLGYKGPYVDYSARPDAGNFPVKLL